MLLVTPDSVTFDGPGILDRWVVLGFNLSLLHSLFPFLTYTFSWNSVSWSISTELGFYMVFPLLLVNIERTWKVLAPRCSWPASWRFGERSARLLRAAT